MINKGAEMKSNCIICKKRIGCLNYLLGSLPRGTYCDRFQEEKDMTDEEQEELQKKMLNHK